MVIKLCCVKLMGHWGVLHQLKLHLPCLSVRSQSSCWFQTHGVDFLGRLPHPDVAVKRSGFVFSVNKTAI